MINKSYGQFFKKLSPKKIGFLYNFGTEDNFIFNDPDYFYTTNTYKVQLFYPLASYKKFSFELIVQPQYQSVKHQLLNKWFVTPEQENYLEKRALYTQLKSINLYSIEFGFSTKHPVFSFLDAVLKISVGLSSIDTATERLAKGFTFIENASLGFDIKTSKATSLYIGSNLGHVSNFDFQLPNDGYNIFGIEVGFSYKLN